MDEMVKATNTCTLADIQKYLASLDVTLSLQAISTYSRKLLASLEDIRVTNERMNAWCGKRRSIRSWIFPR